MTEGQSDTWPCPDWYALVQAAKYLNTTPWDLLAQSIYWRERALLALTAESQAQKIINDRGK